MANLKGFDLLLDIAAVAISIVLEANHNHRISALSAFSLLHFYRIIFIDFYILRDSRFFRKSMERWMVPLNRWILAELPGTKIIHLIGGFFDLFRKFKGCCGKKTVFYKETNDLLK